MSLRVKQLITLAGAALMSGALVTSAVAQSFPDRPVRMIVPFAAGGVTDLAAQADVIAAMKSPAVIERLEQVGAESVGLPGAEMTARIKAEIEDMSKTAREAGIQLPD